MIKYIIIGGVLSIGIVGGLCAYLKHCKKSKQKPRGVIVNNKTGEWMYLD